MGEGGCCSGCLGAVFAIVGAILGIAWAIVEFLGKTFISILGWIFEKIFELIAKIGLLIKDIYLMVNQWCVNLVGISAWGVFLIVLAIVLAIVLICVAVKKISIWRMKSKIKEITQNAQMFEGQQRYWKASREWRKACRIVSGHRKKGEHDEELEKILNELQCECDGALSNALENDTKAIDDKAKALDEQGRFKEAAEAWGEAYQLANEKRQGFYCGTCTKLLIKTFLVLYDEANRKAIRAEADTFINKAKELEDSGQFRDAAGEWEKALRFMKKRTTDAQEKKYVDQVNAEFEEKYEQALFNDASLAVKPLIKKAKESLSRGDYLTASKLYQNAAEEYGNYTPYVSMIISAADDCEEKYKKYVAKHVEKEINALEGLNW